MKNKWIAMILVLSLAMNAAVLAVAGYGYFRTISRPTAAAGQTPKGDHHFYEMLGLTPAQLEMIIPMAAQFHEHLKSLHSGMDEKKAAMIGLLADKRVALNRIEALRKEMAANQDEIQKTVIAHVLDVKAILDSDQQQRFFDLLRKSMTREHGIFTGTRE